MKKNYILTFTFLLFFLQTVTAQLPVSHTASNKNAVLEEFTGIHCVYCPDGHKIANQIQNSHPNDVVLINVHTGGYANPRPGEPDFRTSFGSSLGNQSNLSGYPSGTVNRHVFSGSATAMGRNSWSSAVNQIIAQSSYCNIALEGTIDTQTRLLTVDVELYYTGNNAPASNYINVVLLQDDVEGPQTGSSVFYPEMILPNGNYKHMHMLRHMLTGQWGDQVTTTAQNNLIQRQYTYVIPEQLNGVPLDLGSLRIAAFVSENHQEIITGSNGVLTLTNFMYTNNVSIENSSAVMSFYNNYFRDEICSPSQFIPKIRINNLNSTDITSMTFTYDMNGETSHTYNWTGNINGFTGKQIEIPNFDFAVLDNNTFTVTVTDVNGSADEVNADSNIVVSNINKTVKEGVGTDYVVVITQDQYGSEITWKIFDENNNQVASGGPYADLGGSGVLVHNHNVTLPYGCYSFEIYDSYGDGACCQYGNGSYKIQTASGDVVLNESSDYTTKAIAAFTTNATANIVDTELDFVTIYPIPNKGQLTIETSKAIKINITNMLGKRVYNPIDIYHAKVLDLSNLNDGIYFININDGMNSFTKKIILNK